MSQIRRLAAILAADVVGVDAEACAGPGRRRRRRAFSPSDQDVVGAGASLRRACLTAKISTSFPRRLYETT
jgi:hypothetical protein